VATQTARRLIAREREHGSTDDSDHGSGDGALYGATQRAILNLREAMGDDGCDALLARAVANTRSRHPLVTELGDGATLIPSRGRLTAAIATHGEAVVEAAVEALLAFVIDIVARLIGEDMTIGIIDRDPPPELVTRMPS
jgi:hypothetical protein